MHALLQRSASFPYDTEVCEPAIRVRHLCGRQIRWSVVPNQPALVVDLSVSQCPAGHCLPWFSDKPPWIYAGEHTVPKPILFDCMMLRSLRHCRQLELQCVSVQPMAVKHPVNEPSSVTGPPQRLSPKPQRQFAVQHSSHSSHPGKVPSWQPIKPATPRKPASGKPPRSSVDQIHRSVSSTPVAEDKEQPSPWDINCMLVDASSAENILSIFAKYKERFNIVNISTALHRIAKVLLDCLLLPFAALDVESAFVLRKHCTEPPPGL